MQIRCQHCHRPFGLSRETVHNALDLLAAENLAHYNVNCPHCGKTMRVARVELQRSAPDWGREHPDQTSQA
jgi:transposase-like protein